MDHRFIARAMCHVTNEVLWKPRMAWATKHNPTAALHIRVGNGKSTYLRHLRDTSKNASMTLTYGVKMVATKTDPEYMCKWLTTREVHERRYYGGELNLLNVLAHTIAHEFGHFVQVILGRRYDGSVHNAEFYTVLDRIHASDDGNKIRTALNALCLKRNMDLRCVVPSRASLLALSGQRPDGQKILTMRDVSIGDKLWPNNSATLGGAPVKVVEKRRTRIVVASLGDTPLRLIGHPGAFSKTPPSA